MESFIDKRTGEIKNAFSIRSNTERVYIRFSETGKEYSYLLTNVEIINNSGKKIPIYSYTRECYRCGKSTEILTYMLYVGDEYESLSFPWDKKRLND